MRKPRIFTLCIYFLSSFIILSILFAFYHTQLKGENASTLGEFRTNPSRLKGRHLPINPHNHHVMMSNPRLCEGSKVNLLILVASSAENMERRNAIRQSWGSKHSLQSTNGKILFLLANPNNKAIQKQIVEEYRTYGDLMQEDFQESYMNLTTKTMMGIKWASQHCNLADFILKTDDDVYVNIYLLHEYLKPKYRDTVFIGCMKQKKTFFPAKTDGLPPRHPPFLAGAGYVFSGSLLKKLYEKSLSLKSMPIEDVYVTGHLAKAVTAALIHDSRFTCGERVAKDCDMKFAFTGHGVTPQRMHTIHLKLTGKEKC